MHQNEQSYTTSVLCKWALRHRYVEYSSKNGFRYDVTLRPPSQTDLIELCLEAGLIRFTKIFP